MKEATGELNITVITIVAIAALAAFFYVLIWPGVQANMALSNACNSGEGVTANEPDGTGSDQGSVTCEGSRATGDLKCKYTNASGKTYEKTC